MSLIRSEGSGDAAEKFYNGAMTNSIRLPAPSGGGYLSRTFDNNTTTNDWTFSTWIKRSVVGTWSTVFYASSTSNPYYQSGLHFQTTDTLRFYHFSNTNTPPGGMHNIVETTTKFRDTSAWYHIVLQRDNNGNTVIYVNGTQEASSGSSSNYRYINGTSYSHYLGNYTYQSNPGGFYHGYMADTHFVDNDLVAPSVFAETKEGVWIPIKTPNVTYGNNGFRLEFKETGTSQNSSGIGADTSGEDNHWAVTTLVASDVVPDTPENNFCTLNAIDVGGHTPATNDAMTLAEGNLKVTHDNTGQWQGHRGTFPVSSGKWYYEVQMTTRPTHITENYGIGFFKADKYNQMYYGLAGNLAFGMNGNNAQTYKDTATTAYGTAADADGETYMVAVDFDNSKIWFGLEGSWMASGDPAAGSNPSISSFDAGTYLPLISSYAYAGSAMGVWIFNFGQEGTFAGTKTAGDNADDNGYGNFLYDEPAGFLAMCSANLDEPNIGPHSATQADDHFEATLYTSDNIGSGGTQNVTNVNFQPDLVWLKNRDSSSTEHTLFDSSRSTGGNNYHLATNGTAAQVGANSEYGYLSAFNSNGFTLTGGSTNANYVNQSTDKYIAWNWKANGGTATASASESGTTPTYSVQANTTSGFSIVTYTGTGANGTVPHGLGAVPELVIYRCYSDSSSSDHWYVYSKYAATSNPERYEQYLNLTYQAYEDSDNTRAFNATAPTSTVFSIGDIADVNENDELYIAYCFTPIEGFSKMGTYIGSGTSDGPVIYTGFKPAWVMMKRTDTADNWVILDSARSTFNPRDDYLYIENFQAEATHSSVAIDLLSNGFKCTGNATNVNTSGGTYMYLAFAEIPFKYANAG